MSSNLYWRPRTSGEKPLSDELKYALKNSDKFNQDLDCTIGDSWLDYLSGLRDAGIKDAQKLIDAIEKYGEIELKERY